MEISLDNQDEVKLIKLLNKELRHVETSRLTKLSSVLDKAEAWKKLLEVLTKPQHDKKSNVVLEGLHLPLDAINLIEQQFYCGKSCTMALLNHWAITGRRRPTVRTLLHYLHVCNMNWAKDQVYRYILDINPENSQPSGVDSPPLNAPSSLDTIAYDIDKEFLFHDLDELVDSLHVKLVRYSFESIYKSTNGFCHKLYNRLTGEGSKIGEGRFSSVFKARTLPCESNGQQQVVAAKLLKSECNKKYLANEINLSAKIKDNNILELLGVSMGYNNNKNYNNNNYICLVYPYMENGSLLDCIKSGLPTKMMRPLDWRERIDIAIKVARGISYLHTFEDAPIIHRDIKSANILIGADLQPKIGDFTLVRQLDQVSFQETQYSQNVIGTCVYMPPEAFRGDISTKFDTFSYGIILLELLSGLKPFDEQLEEDILTHIKYKLSDIDDELAKSTQLIGQDSAVSTALEKEAKDKFLAQLLDKNAGEWNFAKSRELFIISLASTDEMKKTRPELISLLPAIEALSE